LPAAKSSIAIGAASRITVGEGSKQLPAPSTRYAGNEIATMTALLRAPGLSLPDQSDVRWTSFTKAIRLPEQSWPAQICERPIIVGRLGGRTMALVADPEAAKSILAGPESRFPKWKIYSRVVGRGAGYENISATGGEKCQHQRRALAPLFSSSRMPALTPTFRAAAEHAASQWLEAEEPVRIDACLEMTRITLDTIWRAIFGVEADAPRAEMVDQAARCINAAQLQNDINGPAGHIDALALHSSRLPLHEGAADSNPFTLLRNGGGEADSGGNLTRTELYDNARLLLGAGHETTSLTLTWALWLIGQDDCVQDRVSAEIESIVGDDSIAGTTCQSNR
jgi:cytochrome P450